MWEDLIVLESYFKTDIQMLQTTISAEGSDPVDWVSLVSVSLD